MSVTKEETWMYNGDRVKDRVGLRRSARVERVSFVDSSIRSINEGAFWECYNLKSVSIPPFVTAIGAGAFAQCTGLESVEIPPSVTIIGYKAFFDCCELKSAVVPRSVVTIKREAFKGCNNLDGDTKQSFANRFKKLDQKETFEQGPGPKLNFKGSTQNGWGPEWWGITLDQMENLLHHPLLHLRPDTLMRDVVNLVIKPMTKNSGAGYALLLNQDKPLRANIMVSHAWDEPFDEFIGCIYNSGETGPFWVCAFSMYQSDGGDDTPTISDQLGPDPSYGPFATVIRVSVSMITVLTRVCDIYTRLWCVFELHEAQKLGLFVKLCPFIRPGEVMIGFLERDICIKNIESRVDSLSALCSNESDKRDIHTAILSQSQDGFEDINISVEKIRLQYLLDYPVRDIVGAEYVPNEFIMKRQKKAVELLAARIIIMVDRLFSLGDSVPAFKAKEPSRYFCTNKTPIDDFCEWKSSLETYLRRMGIEF